MDNNLFSGGENHYGLIVCSDKRGEKIMKVLGGLISAATLLISVTLPAAAQMCPSAGERTQGFNKICYYNCLSGLTTKTISSVSLCPISIQDKTTKGRESLGNSKPNNVTCFKTGEFVDNTNKICRYDCLGSPAEMTIGSLELCPLTIKR